MERLRILAAAATLDQFTIPQLASFVGAKENTVRSTVARENGLFAVEGTRRTGKGRPASLHRVVDPERIRAELRQIADIAGPQVVEENTGSDTSERRRAAVAIAEDAVLRALSTPSEDSVVLTQTALESVKQAREMGLEEGDPLSRRAETVTVFAEIAEAEARGEQITVDDLVRASSAIAAYSDVAPDERAGDFVQCLGQAARRTDQLPALEVLVGRDERPEEVSDAFANAGWTRLVVEGSAIAADEGEEVLWGQTWARPLFSRDLSAGYVVLSHGLSAGGLERSLLRARYRHVPTVVIGEQASEATLARVAEAGAHFLPASATRRDSLTNTLVNAIGPRPERAG